MMKSDMEYRRSYIVELPGSVIKLLAQLVHIHLVGYPKNKTARAALEILCDQTPFVQRDPRRHGVFTEKVAVDRRSELSPSVYHIPIK